MRWKNLAVFGAANVLFFGNLFYPVIRFESPELNGLFGFALAFLLPWLAVMAIFRVGRRWTTIIAIIAILPTVLYSGVVGFAFMWTGFGLDGRDNTFERFSDSRWQRSHIRLYRTDGGATTDFGVVVRQERTLFPGVEIVRPIDSFYHCYSLNVSATDSGIKLSDPAATCQTFSGRSREYRLKPFVYF